MNFFGGTCNTLIPAFGFSTKRAIILTDLLLFRFFDSLGGAVSVVSDDGKPKSAVMVDNDDFESASQVGIEIREEKCRCFTFCSHG